MTPTATETSKSQLAYDYLRDRITAGDYTPGYRLVLGQIARELGCSTVPVREAIRRLEAEGAVTYVHNVGAQVTLLDRGVYRETMETLGLVEGFATALSAPHLTEADLAEASEINAAMRAMLDGAGPDSANLDANRFTGLNQEFHTVLFQHCTNGHVADLVRRGWHRLETMRESSFAFAPTRTLTSVHEHDDLIALIRTGADSGDIELAARQHRFNTMAAVLDAIAADD